MDGASLISRHGARQWDDDFAKNTVAEVAK